MDPFKGNILVFAFKMLQSQVGLSELLLELLCQSVGQLLINGGGKNFDKIPGLHCRLATQRKKAIPYRSYVIEDNDGGMTPDKMRRCMSLSYSEKSKLANTIGQGIFRTNGENGQEEDVRKQLNIGFVPHGVDVDCLVGFIKGLARSMPTSGALDYVAEKPNLPFFEV
ncbi:hypothetical protein Tco_0889771 [Tanacetum coccineum]